MSVYYRDSAPNPSANSIKTSHDRKISKPRQIVLSDLRPSSRKAGVGPSALENSDDNSFTESTSYDGSDLTAFTGISAEQSAFIRSLWNAINVSIEDEPFLSEYNHTGQVFLRFTIDREGHLDAKNFRASAVDRVLKVIAARAVRKALATNAYLIHFPKDRILIHTRFSWSSYQACESLRGYHQTFLSFCRYAENKRKTFSGSERVSHHISALWQHGPWAYEEIKKYNQEQSHRTGEFNPFEKYERDQDWNL